jgi:hypothetical protein
MCSVENILLCRSKALKGRQMIAQGKAAQPPPPWVTIQIKRSFFIIRPRRRRMMKKQPTRWYPKFIVQHAL